MAKISIREGVNIEDLSKGDIMIYHNESPELIMGITHTGQYRVISTFQRTDSGIAARTNMSYDIKSGIFGIRTDSPVISREKHQKLYDSMDDMLKEANL